MTIDTNTGKGAGEGEERGEGGKARKVKKKHRTTENNLNATVATWQNRHNLTVD